MLKLHQEPLPEKALTIKQHIFFSTFWCGSNVIWGALLGILIPNIVEHIVSAESKSTAVGTTIGSGAVIALILPLFVGGLSDRCMSRWGRRRPYILVGTLISILGLFLMYQAFNLKAYLVFILSYLVIQVGTNIANTSYSGMMPDIIPLNQRGLSSGFMGVMSNLGTMFGILISNYFAKINIFFAFLTIVLFVFLTMLVTIFGTHETPLNEAPPKISWIDYIKSLWINPKQHPDFAWVWLTRFFVMLGFYSIQPYLQYYLKEMIHVKNPLRDMAILGGIILLSATISGLIAGIISDKIGKKKVVYIANTLIALMSLSFIFAKSFDHIVIIGILFGIGYGAYISVDWALGTTVLPSQTNAAKEMAVWHIAMTLPQMLGTPFVGWLIKLFGIQTIGGIASYTQKGYAAMFIMATVFFLLGALGLKNVKGTN